MHEAIALAVVWRQLVCAARESGIPQEEREALIEQADGVLDRLAEIPALTEKALAVKILVWNCECDEGDTIVSLHLCASIVADAQRLAGLELAGIFSGPVRAEPRGLLDEARERGATWAREHVLRPRGTVPDVFRRALAAD